MIKERRTGVFLTAAVVILILCAGLPACKRGPRGQTGATGAPGTPTSPSSTALEETQDLPGVVIAVVSVSGATGAGGQFQVGDVMKVKFTVKRNDGSSLPLSELTSGETHFSGPSFNYQRVLTRKTDLISKSVQNSDGSYTYSFEAIPAVYAAPPNDTGAFPDGVLKGQALLSGTYTIALIAYRNYTVGNETVKDVANTAYDVLFGTATTLEHREVVTQRNCNQCHVNIQWHTRGLPGGGRRRDVSLCGTCHVAGAEDFDHTGTELEGSPKVPVEFKVLVHKIHNAAHLPSGVGVGVDGSGNRVYNLAPRKFESVTDELEIEDFSDINFPLWPNLDFPLPKKQGYGALSGTGLNGLSYKTNDDTIRKGNTICEKCHGVPSPSTLGFAPDAATKVVNYPAPAQGNLVYTQLSRRACGSCHDDIDWTKQYVKNGQTMPPQTTDADCVTCHVAGKGDSLDPVKAHLHPLSDPALNPGYNFNISAVDNGAGKDLTTTAAANGDKVRLTFTLKDDAGNDVPVDSLDSTSLMIVGPTTNRQVLFPYPSPNGVSINGFDFSGRLVAPSATGKGSVGKAVGAGVTETLTVLFSSATAYAVTGSVSGALGAGALPASPSTNPNGSSISGWSLTTAAVAETITVNFTSATEFTVTGSVSGVLGTGTLPAAKSASVRFVSANGTVAFLVSVGANEFAAGNNIYLDIFKGAAANPVILPVVAGRTSFAANDRFYYEAVNESTTTYTYYLPMDLALEYLGQGDGTIGQTLAAANVPVYFGRQSLSEVTALSAGDLAVSATYGVFSRYLDVPSTSALANNDFVMVDNLGGALLRECVQVGYLETLANTDKRLWFKTPLRFQHSGAAITVQKATLTLRLEGVHYTLTPATGTITSLVAFGATNPIIMTYRTDGAIGWKRAAGDALQTKYFPPMNDSPVLDETWGDWTGKSFVSGTYTVGIWASKNLDIAANGEVQTYRSGAVASPVDILYGTATEIVPHLLISTSANCDACHGTVMFHGGGRWGLDTCLFCHSISGAEDLPKYNNPVADATPGVTIEFRTMLHKIHRGSELAKAETYAVVGNGPTTHYYDEVGFPAFPSGVKDCSKCHGLPDQGLPVQVWDAPSDRNHPTEQTEPLHAWRSVCLACHDSNDVQGHHDLMTSSTGYESCGTCHGQPASEIFTGVKHKTH